MIAVPALLGAEYKPAAPMEPKPLATDQMKVGWLAMATLNWSKAVGGNRRAGRRHTDGG